MTDTDRAALLRERYFTREDALWAALMVCVDCDHRMIEHDEVAMRCAVCDCDQGQRGLSSYADHRLTDLGEAIREAWPKEAPRTLDAALARPAAQEPGS